MKKILAIILSLCLLCGAVALAETQITQDSAEKKAETQVTYTIEASKEYTVTIPSQATFTDGTSNNTILVNATNYDIDENKTVTFNVQLTGSTNFSEGKFYLANGTNKIAYNMYITGGGGQVMSVPATIVEAAFTNDTAANLRTASKNLQLTIGSTTDAVPGTYTDTLTFAVSVTEQ